jgi:hypothetical protein
MSGCGCEIEIKNREQSRTLIINGAKQNVDGERLYRQKFSFILNNNTTPILAEQ